MAQPTTRFRRMVANKKYPHGSISSTNYTGHALDAQIKALSKYLPPGTWRIKAGDETSIAYAGGHGRLVEFRRISTGCCGFYLYRGDRVSFMGIKGAGDWTTKQQLYYLHQLAIVMGKLTQIYAEYTSAMLVGLTSSWEESPFVDLVAKYGKYKTASRFLNKKTNHICRVYTKMFPGGKKETDTFGYNEVRLLTKTSIPYPTH